jgi:membrane-bound lytic murein transglycosylase MltF
MQVMPATGKELNVGDISQLEANIHAGVKYMRWIVDEYYKDEPMDTLNKGLFAFASYNAGAGRIRQLRKEAAKRGLDPNVWFGNVEQIASERIGRETVTYVTISTSTTWPTGSSSRRRSDVRAPRRLESASSKESN